jgi:hypothetical protein
MGPGLNDGTYALEIQVSDQDITADEHDNPVKTLRSRFDRWTRSQTQRSPGVH